VVGDVRRAPLGTFNAAGTVNNDGNRVDVDFRRLVFGLDSVLGQQLEPPLRKVIVPKQNPDAAQPANDVTYLDDTCRITRGGDDSLFIFRREASMRPMLSLDERAALYAEGGESTVTGDGVAGKDAAPPEVRPVQTVQRKPNHYLCSPSSGTIRSLVLISYGHFCASNGRIVSSPSNPVVSWQDETRVSSLPAAALQLYRGDCSGLQAAA
jgi:hypothetical protein